jgi:uncharacterized protein (DUF885 family)
MTPQELELLRLQARIVAVEGLLVTLFAAIASTPSSREILREKLDNYDASMAPMRFKDMSAEYSDLYAAELQEAIASLNGFLKDQLDKKDKKG